MNNQQKYLGTGMAIAMLIVILTKAFTTFGNAAGFWIILLATIAAGATYLVFNMLVLTKKITAVPVRAVQKDKKP